MPKKKQIINIPKERVESKIFFIKGKRVMIDSDLAELYGVETKVLNHFELRNTLNPHFSVEW